MRIIRDYEVSIWTLQDSFITVLKPFGIELKGQIQDPDFKLIDDGTQEFSFKLPMYYSLNGERIENPLWCNTINGVIVASMRKVKLIFKKHTPQQKVYEFLITKVVESHEKDQLMCEVTCEGLAFHELGKIGYRIALETQDITYDQDAWYDGEEKVDEETGEKYILGSDQRRYSLDMPRPSLQYWNDKIFKRKDGNWKWDWTYEIQMDYSNNPGLGREENKVYEDEYVSSWSYNSERDQIEAKAYENDREKWRTVDLTDSNVYNLTQDLAKKFGVFCRYEYKHDDNFHIVGRKVVYYNNFIMEKTGALDISYPYQASKIARTSDSTDMITKMYVEVESEDEGEEVTIMNSSANKTREDYILNFDYLNTIGAITSQQYTEVKKFETAVYNLNMQIAPLQARIAALKGELPDLEANETVLKNSIAGDIEARSQANDFLNALTDGTGTVTVTANNPKMGMILGSDPEYIKITELGVDYSTLRIFKTYNTTTHVLTDEYRGTPIYDEFNNLIQIQNPKHFQSYYYLPSNGVYSVSGEYGHLRYYNTNNYQFLFDSVAFRDIFRKLNGCLLTSLNLSFNLTLETIPTQPFNVDLYIAHKSSSNENEPVYSFLKSYSIQMPTTSDKYTLRLAIDPTEELETDFRFNSNDAQQGIYLKVAITFASDEQFIKQPIVDQNEKPTLGLKASLSLGGKKETVEGGAPRVQSRVYLTYTYSPKTYYESVIQIWLNREVIDTRNLENIQKRISNIKEMINKYEVELNNYLDEKDLLLTRFERLMGPALREGYWQPEEYQDYGDQYLEAFSTKNAPIAAVYYTDDEEVKAKINYIDDSVDDTTVQLKYILDSEPFTGETVNYIDSFSKENEEEYIYYPCIKLNNSNILQFVKKNYDKLSVSFCDVTQLDIKYRTNPAYRKIYHINSRCEYAYMNINGAPTPVIMVTGALNDNLTDRQLAALTGQVYKDGNVIYDEFNNIDVRLTVMDPLKPDIQESYKLNKKDWYIPTDPKQMLYPRLQISSLNIRTDDDEFDVKYGGNLLSNYNDYSLLSRDNSYYVTFKPIIFAQYGIGLDGEVRFIASNANTTVYLDALQVAKENSRPKVEYEITINTVNKELIDEAYNYLGYIANINDFDLKFEDVRGYISELDLKLDKPWEDSATIKNYKTKFEDLFSTIVAQTEQMQKNATTIAVASQSFTANGKLIPDVVEESIRHVDLSEAFSKGTLTWNEAEGMWAESDSGVVAIRGGGIFTATQKTPSGDWKWNTGITPEGINADLITAGQLDTNRIKVYAGDQLRFQLNGDGLFAYKTIFDNPKIEYTLASNYSSVSKELEDNHGIDYRQYVVHNGEGIFLIAKEGAPLILEDRGQDGYYIKRLQQDVNRVAISWDGLTLRNYNNEKVFFADADTGNLTISGTIYAHGGVFDGEVRARSLFIGDDTENNLANAQLTVDSQTGLINLSSLKFDSLGDGSNSESGIRITPEGLFFYTTVTKAEQVGENNETLTTVVSNSMNITQDGIQIKADGIIDIDSDNENSRLAFGPEGQPESLIIGGVAGTIQCKELTVQDLIIRGSIQSESGMGKSFITNGLLGDKPWKITSMYISDDLVPTKTEINENENADDYIEIPAHSIWMQKDTTHFESGQGTINANYEYKKSGKAAYGYNQYFMIVYQVQEEITHVSNVTVEFYSQNFPKKLVCGSLHYTIDIDQDSYKVSEQIGEVDGISVDPTNDNGEFQSTIQAGKPVHYTMKRKEWEDLLEKDRPTIRKGKYIIIRGSYAITSYNSSSQDNVNDGRGVNQFKTTCAIAGTVQVPKESNAVFDFQKISYIASTVYYKLPTPSQEQPTTPEEEPTTPDE